MSRKNAAAVALGRLGGKAKTPAKAAASRENGKKGGRPRKCKRVVIEYIKSVDVEKRGKALPPALGLALQAVAGKAPTGNTP